MAKREREGEKVGEKGDEGLGVEKNERVGQRGNEGGKEEKKKL